MQSKVRWYHVLGVFCLMSLAPGLVFLAALILYLTNRGVGLEHVFVVGVIALWAAVMATGWVFSKE